MLERSDAAEKMMSGYSRENGNVRDNSKHVHVPPERKQMQIHEYNLFVLSKKENRRKVWNTAINFQ